MLIDIPTNFTLLGWVIYFIGYVQDLISLNGYCLAGFIILCLSFLAEACLVNLTRPKKVSLLSSQALYIPKDQSKAYNAKLIISSLFLTACVIGLTWQIIARTVDFEIHKESIQTIVYLYLWSMLVIFVLFAVASCYAITQVNHFYTESKMLARASYGAIALGSAIDFSALVVLLFAVYDVVYLNVDYYIYFMIGHIFIGIGFTGRLAFQEVKD
jgi:hypothetical protein